MNDLENLVRASLQRHADRGADPAEVRAFIATNRPTSRIGRNLVLTGVAVAVAGAAVAVPILSQSTPAETGTGSVVSSSPATTPVPYSVPLEYDLPNPPPNLREQVRGSGPGTRGRTWILADDKRLSLSVFDNEDLSPTGDPVTINGRPGVFYGPDVKTGLEWLAADGRKMVLIEKGLGLGRPKLVELASSVVASTDEVTMPATFAWIPSDLRADALLAQGESARSWSFTLQLEKPDNIPMDVTSRVIRVMVRTSSDVPAGGSPVTVDGRAGRYVEQPNAEHQEVRRLEVPLGDGRFLILSADEGITRDELLRVAAGIQLTEPDLSWIGTR